MNTENLEKLVNAFCAALEVEPSVVNDNIKYQGIPQWDSITHMFLISEIENVFAIEIDPDDILDMSSFEKSKEILSKYNIDF